MRPLVEQRPSSAESGYQPYPPHPTGPSGIAAGAPAPLAALAAAEEAARNRTDDRPPAAPKRLRDYEDELKAMNGDEKRPRLDDSVPRPPSVTDRRNSPSAHRASLDRALANSENYHPSEAAHHPPPVGPTQLPAINSTAPNSAGSAAPSLPPLEGMKEEREGSARPPARVEEPPARKMDVDENYDDDELEGKEKVSERSSPRTAGEAAAAVA